MQKSPAVSVMMCVYNSERYLPKAIEGILKQTFPDFELVAADDGSTDHSIDILQNYARQDTRISLLAGGHAGLVATRNRALAASRGEFIAIADSDDISLPARLETQVGFLRRHPQFVAVGCSRKLIDSDGAPICNLHAAGRARDARARH